MWRQSRTAGRGAGVCASPSTSVDVCDPFTRQDACSTGPPPQDATRLGGGDTGGATDLWPCDRSTSDLSIAMRFALSWFSRSRLRCSVSRSEAHASASRRKDRVCSCSCQGKIAAALKPASTVSFRDARRPLPRTTAADAHAGHPRRQVLIRSRTPTLHLQSGTRTLPGERARRQHLRSQPPRRAKPLSRPQGEMQLPGTRGSLVHVSL